MLNGKNNPNYKHGGTCEHKKEFNSWRAMRERCDNKNYRYYHRYGGRGITYCEEWKNFANFLNDMGERPDGCSLDRIDNNKGYSPENCRWATQSQQIKNSTKVTSAKLDLSRAKNAKCSISLVYKRLKNGWNMEEAINTPAKTVWEQNHEKAMQNHNICPVCGERCKKKRDKYCCKEHFWMTRTKDGKFSMEVENDVKKKQKKV